MSINPQTPQENVVIGRSVKMRAVFEFVDVISRSDSTVLITGESGTGKEVIATLIHQSSRRKHRPFVAVSCTLFSETLIESELFGHERGAFTGAIKDRPGRFEMAEGGTIFLDDIDDVPLGMQVKLLRGCRTARSSDWAERAWYRSTSVSSRAASATSSNWWRKENSARTCITA